MQDPAPPPENLCLAKCGGPPTDVREDERSESASRGKACLARDPARAVAADTFWGMVAGGRPLRNVCWRIQGHDVRAFTYGLRAGPEPSEHAVFFRLGLPAPALPDDWLPSRPGSVERRRC